ncbi:MULTISPECIES: hypothetical protein [unclassified Pedobacter]|uniref:hypothetical protein n=1 Tax=unclassified Pedobacter TaxID=2628915 RepID=UPI0014212538|nr:MULTISPECIES: hypothetical protein [unclassified Pedobacter]NII81738.1 hypothetical protein [Pedobacter sp. SG908]NMN35741.1 hypothetical protein [Pedobacter sp. SG918]
MNKSFADQLEDNARLDFKLFEAEKNLQDMIAKVEAYDVSDEVRQKLFNWINEVRPNLMNAIAFKEIHK